MSASGSFSYSLYAIQLRSYNSPIAQANTVNDQYQPDWSGFDEKLQVEMMNEKLAYISEKIKTIDLVENTFTFSLKPIRPINDHVVSSDLLERSIPQSFLNSYSQLIQQKMLQNARIAFVLQDLQTISVRLIPLKLQDIQLLTNVLH